MFDGGDGAFRFAENCQIGSDDFVAATFGGFHNSPAHRQSFAVARQGVMLRFAGRVNPHSQREVLHKDFVRLRDPKRRMANSAAIQRRIINHVFQKLCLRGQIQGEFQRTESVSGFVRSDGCRPAIVFGWLSFWRIGVDENRR